MKPSPYQTWMLLGSLCAITGLIMIGSAVVGLFAAATLEPGAERLDLGRPSHIVGAALFVVGGLILSLGAGRLGRKRRRRRGTTAATGRRAGDLESYLRDEGLLDGEAASGTRY